MGRLDLILFAVVGLGALAPGFVLFHKGWRRTGFLVFLASLATVMTPLYGAPVALAAWAAALKLPNRRPT